MRLRLGRKVVDDYHLPAAEGTMHGGLAGHDRLRVGFRITGRILLLLRDFQQLAAQGDLLAAESVRQESIVANPHEARRQHMQKETSDELDWLQRQYFPTPTIGIVLVPKTHLATFHVNQATVGDRDAMCITGQILQYDFR